MNRTLAKAGCRRPHPCTETGRLYALRPDPKPEKAGDDPVVSSEEEAQPETGDAIICRQCLHLITWATERSVIKGAHVHTYANPEGIVFEIACFRNARGCGYVGPASSEFTWFAGYLWRIAVCANCHVHLGWRFHSADGHYFHGLITSRIVSRDM